MTTKTINRYFLKITSSLLKLANYIMAKGYQQQAFFHRALLQLHLDSITVHNFCS